MYRLISTTDTTTTSGATTSKYPPNVDFLMFFVFFLEFYVDFHFTPQQIFDAFFAAPGRRVSSLCH